MKVPAWEVTATAGL